MIPLTVPDRVTTEDLQEQHDGGLGRAGAGGSGGNGSG